VYWIIYALLFAVVCGIVADCRGRSALAWGALGAIFGVFAVIVLICLEIPHRTGLSPILQRSETAPKKNCPFCSESIIRTAIKCRYCQSDLPVTQELSTKEHMTRHNGVLMRVSEIPKNSDEG